MIRFSVWDGWELIEEYGSVRATAFLQGATGVIKSWGNNGTIYYYQDKLGSTTHIANASGALLESYRYDLSGTPKYFDSTSQPLNSSTHGIVDLYAGERWVSELGLYDLRNRFMSPELGRFLQADPIGFKGDASNLYRYCHNDPENFTDRMGLVDTSAIRQYSTLTSFGGGDWIKGSDGLSALDWNDKWRAQAGVDQITMGQVQPRPAGRLSDESRGLRLPSWRSPTPVKGGTFAQRQYLRNELRRVRETPRGKELVEMIRARGDPVTVYVIAGGNGWAETPANEMWINPNFHPPTKTAGGTIAGSVARTIGHELGHAVTGVHDSGPGDMDNVILNENPIANALGEPSRTEY